jgi:multidrug resistance protein
MHSQDQEMQQDQTNALTDWTGPDDLDNPQRWSLQKKVYHTIIPTSIAFLCPFGSSVYTPARNEIMAQFGVSKEVSLLPFCLYLLGLSFGPVIAAPTSETFGRKAVYIAGLPLFGLFTLGAGFSNNITSLTVCRFFAGLFSSPGLSIGTGTISDVWITEKKGLPMAAFITSVQMGPALGPLVGGFVVERENWRWTQWTILFALVIIIGNTLPMSETFKKVILKRRAESLGADWPSEQKSSESETIRYFLTTTIIRPMHMLFTEKIVTLLDLYVATSFGLLNAFFAAFPLVFEEQYNFGPEIVGLTFLGQAVGSLAGFLMVIAFDKYFYQPRSKAQRESNPSSKVQPEQRLWIAMLGAPMLPASLFWFGWTAKPSIHWISPVTAEAMFSCGNLLIFTSASLYLTDAYGALYGASAWSSNTFLRYLFAAVFPLFVEQMYGGLGVGWASSLLGFVTLALTPIPYTFYIWGESLRKNSVYNPDP